MSSLVFIDIMLSTFMLLSSLVVLYFPCLLSLLSSNLIVVIFHGYPIIVQCYLNYFNGFKLPFFNINYLVKFFTKV